MKAYIVTTGSLFGLLALAHVWRIIAEWPRLLHEPAEIIVAAMGLVAAVLCVWAWRLWRSGADQPKAGAAA